MLHFVQRCRCYENFGIVQDKLKRFGFSKYILEEYRSWCIGSNCIWPLRFRQRIRTNERKSVNNLNKTHSVYLAYLIMQQSAWQVNPLMSKLFQMNKKINQYFIFSFVQLVNLTWIKKFLFIISKNLWKSRKYIGSVQKCPIYYSNVKQLLFLLKVK